MRFRLRDLGFSGAALFAAVLFASPPLRAATITVTTTGDDVFPSDGTVSLREAITAINAGSDLGDPDITAENPTAINPFGTNDTINFTGVTGTITLFSTLPQITTSVAINGPGAGTLTISGGGSIRVFFVDGATVSFSDLTIAHGKSVGGDGGDGSFGGGGGGAGLGGGALVNSGTVAFTNVTFDSNSVSGGVGGGRGSGAASAGGGGGGVDLNDGAPSNGVTGDGGAGGPVSGTTVFGGTGGAGGIANACAPSTSPVAGGDGAGGGGGTGCTGDPSAAGANGGVFGGGGGAGEDFVGGNGGFGGGGGCFGAGGTFGGHGSGSFFSTTGCGGGGGAGMGAAIFIRSGSVTFAGCTFSNNSAAGGSGAALDGESGKAGQGKGGAIFVNPFATATETCPSTFVSNSASDAQTKVTNPQDNPNVYGLLISSDTTPPSLTCTGDQTAFVNTGCKAAVPSFLVSATNDCPGVVVVQVPAVGTLVGPGTHPVTVTATNSSGVSTSCSENFIVNVPPPVVTTSEAIHILASDHTMKDIGFHYSASDSCDGTIPSLPLNCIGLGVSGSGAGICIQIWSNENELVKTDGGSGVTSPDARGLGTAYNSGTWLNKIALRQERLNVGIGRVYLIKVAATDSNGATAYSCQYVISPKSKKTHDIQVAQAAGQAVVGPCNATGAIPSNYVQDGYGPVVGSKQ